MKRSSGSMFSSRAAFLLGMLLAIVATGDAAVTSCTGATGKFNSVNNLGGTGVVACKCVLGYTSASNALILGDKTLDCTKCAAGYYLSAADSTTGGAVCTQIPAGKYGAATLQSLTDVAVAAIEVLKTCPTNSVSVAGSTTGNLNDCTVKAGYYIATESTSCSDDTSILISLATVNSYGAGGVSSCSRTATDDGLTACPYAGTTPATGKAALTDCVPNCGTAAKPEGTVDATTKAMVKGGTCVCASTHYGQPVGANPTSIATAVTQGCVKTGENSIPVGATAAATTDTITLAGHGRSAGDLITLTNPDTGTKGIPDGTYHVLPGSLTSSVFLLGPVTGATTTQKASAGLTDGVAVAGPTIINPIGKVVFPGTTLAANLFTATAHGLSNGDSVEYQSGSGAVAGATHGTDLLVDSTKYYIRDATANKFSLALTPGGAVKAVAAASNTGTVTQLFIYKGVRGFTIPTTGISLVTDRITFAAHGLKDGDGVIYEDSGTAATGLVDGVRYFVRDATTNNFKVSATPGGSAIDITGTGNDAQYFLTSGVSNLALNVGVAGAACPANTEVATLAADGDGVTTLGQCTTKAGWFIKAKNGQIGGSTASLSIKAAEQNSYAAGGLACDQQETAVDAGLTACPFGGTTARILTIPADTTGVTVGTNSILFTAHGLVDGDELLYTKITTDITGLTSGTTYSVVSATANAFKLAEMATPTTVIGLTGVGVAGQFFTPLGKSVVTDCKPGASITIPLAGVTIGDETISSASHGLTDGDYVTYTSTTDIGGLTTTTSYYVTGKTASTFKLAALATPSTVIDLTSTGAAAQTFFIPSSAACGSADVNAVIALGTCKCKAKYYGTPISATAGSVATSGCAVCPYGGDSTAGSTLVTQCTPAASAATVNVTTVSGTTKCKVGHYGSPTPTNAAATGGCTACPPGSTSVVGSTVYTGCKVKAGFYIATKSDAVGAVTGVVISAVPANSYGVGGEQVNQQTVATVNATKLACPFGGKSLVGASYVEDCVPDCGASGNATDAQGTCICSANYYGAPLDATNTAVTVVTKGCSLCPTNSESVAGTANLAGCTVKAGFYIKTKSTSAAVVGALSIVVAPVNWFAVGGASASEQSAGSVSGSRLACPHAGTTPATGKTKVADCVPDCNTNVYANSVALGGTCVCKASDYGAPTPTNVKPTTGCTACLVGSYTQSKYTALTGGSPSSGVAAASTTAADCILQPGFYIATQSTSTTNIASLVVGQIPANKYAAGGTGTKRVTADEAAAAAVLACPYGGTTVVAGNKLADCTPSCGSGVNTVAIGGTCRCADTHYGIPLDASDLTEAIVTKGCLACPTNSATAYTAAAAPGGTIADCKVNAGYYLSVAKAGAATFGTITATPVNTYQAGGATAVDGAAVVPQPCIIKSTSIAGSDSIDDCKVAGGYYLSVASPSATQNGRIARSGSNAYAIGGRSISNTTAETSTSCTYAGTSALGSDARADCTPSCGTVAIASSGTCACKAGRTGTPTPATSAVTGGCTAIKCAVNQYVKANVCTDCAAGTTNAKDDDASLAATTCDATKCAVNEYVKSNVCTKCAAGTTNAKDDDASGADTTCGDVSSASRSDISFATIVMVIATLLACATV